MSRLFGIWRRLRAIVVRRRVEDDMQHEMREHIALATERFIARGMSPTDAAIEARREFGSVGVHQETARDIRGARWIGDLGADVRFAIRHFSRNKLTTATLIAVLAAGIGANIAIFSAVQAVFLRPAPGLPMDPRQVRIYGTIRPTRAAAWKPRELTLPEVRALAERTETFESVAAWIGHRVVVTVSDSSEARAVEADFVTTNYFAVTGVQLIAGTAFPPTDDGSRSVSAIVGASKAEELFGSAAAALGKEIEVNDIPVRIVGVAPKTFGGVVPNNRRTRLWLPLAARANIARVRATWMNEGGALSVVARLAPSATREQGTTIASQLASRSMPDSAERVGMARSAAVRGMREAPPFSQAADEVYVMTAFGIIGVLILLVACTNVSSLMVAAAVARRHEIAVRLSLGATRRRLLRQLLTEAVILATVGGAAGVTLCFWLAKWVEYRGIIQEVDLVPDAATFAFSLLIALGTGILFGLSPAVHATRSGVANALRDAGTGATSRARLQRGLVVAQIVFSQPLLVMLAVILLSVGQESGALPESIARRVTEAEFQPLMQTGGPNQRPEAIEALIPRLKIRPEIAGVIPDAGPINAREITVRGGAPGAPRIVREDGATPGYFALLDIPILLGRDVELSDTIGTDHAIVIGDELARRIWGTENPIGRSIPSPGWNGADDSLNLTVVGVYDETRTMAGEGAIPRVYTAHGKGWRRDVLLIRTHADAEEMIPELRRFAQQAAPGIPLQSIQTLGDIEERERRVRVQVAGLSGGAGMVALFLASLGLYGVVALAVRQRTREIGIRLAVGASAWRVVRMFLLSGVRLGVIGLFIGLPVSIATLRFGLSQGVILGVDPNDWLLALAIAAVLIAVAIVATWLPARHAARIDPASTLRSQ